MARYRDIAADLKTRIVGGEFAPGDQLPPITALMEHYRVPGLNTIRQAQQLLVDDGLVETRQGVGSFVLRAEPVPGQFLSARLWPAAWAGNPALIDTPFACAFIDADSTAAGSISTASICAAPKRAAAMARMPEPQP